MISQIKENFLSNEFLFHLNQQPFEIAIWTFEFGSLNILLGHHVFKIIYLSLHLLLFYMEVLVFNLELSEIIGIQKILKNLILVTLIIFHYLFF